MNRTAVAALVFLLALAGGALWLWPRSGRTLSDPALWEGHVVRFHLPVDQGLDGEGEGAAEIVEEPVIKDNPEAGGELPPEPAKPAGPPPHPFRLSLEPDGKVFWGPKLATTWDDDAPAAIGATVQRAVAEGRTRFEIDAAGEVPARRVIAAMAAVRANGVTAPTTAAGFWDPPARRTAKSGIHQVPRGFSPPQPPRVAAPEARRFTAPTFTTIFLRSTQPHFIASAPGGGPLGLDWDQVVSHLKSQAKRVPVKDRPELSNLTVLIHVDGDVPWSRMGLLMMECAKLGIWRIEAVVAEQD